MWTHFFHAIGEHLVGRDEGVAFWQVCRDLIVDGRAVVAGPGSLNMLERPSEPRFLDEMGSKSQWQAERSCPTK